MAEQANEETKNVDNVTDTAKTETTNTAEVKTQEASGFDPSNITDEDFEKLFKDQRLFTHPRFKSLSERAKKADELEKEREEAEQKQLEAEKKYQELYEKEKTAKSELEAKLQNQLITSAIQAEASKKGVIDLDAVTKLADISSISVKDGAVEGVEEVVSKLVEDKPYLVGAEKSKTVGSPSNPNPSQTEAGTKRFKLSQLQDHKFFKENEADIKDAWRLGLIEDDTAQ